MSKYTLRAFFTIVCFSMLFSPGFSQEEKEDVVYLKNGSVLRGKILKDDVDSTIQIQVYGGSIFVIKTGEVKEIHQEEPFVKNYRIPEQAIRGGINAGALGGRNSYSGFAPILVNFHLSIGYKNYRHSYLLTSGIEFYREPHTPVIFEYQYALKEKQVTPFVYGMAGYTFSITGQFEESPGGPTAGAGIGLKNYYQNGSVFFFSAGSRFQQLKEIQTWRGTTVRIHRLYRFQLRLGFLF